MKIIYSGRPAELLPKERTKLEGKLAKVGKIIERRGEREVHVILSQERHLHKVEITMLVYDHAMVGAASNGDVATAMAEAIEKLEKQILKLRTKRRDTHRKAGEKGEPEAAAAPGKGKAVKTPAAKKKSAAAAKDGAVKSSPKVFRVNHQDGSKPMTLDEAMLEMTDGHDYLVYRDAKTDKVCTLLRRGDGHLDLIES
jgi:putative sigma-54 modulation protein